jgi:predicted nucleic-acid-binding Zn-ribbon protein
MGRYFNCIKCDNDTFIDKGFHLLANSKFQELKCTKCSNSIFLEIDSNKFRQIPVQNEEKNIVKLLKI